MFLFLSELSYLRQRQSHIGQNKHQKQQMMIGYFLPRLPEVSKNVAGSSRDR